VEQIRAYMICKAEKIYKKKVVYAYELWLKVLGD